jgi:predicted negative regulator of RcsB-dependent stress response
MAKQKITRKALLKSPDEFLTFTEKALNFIKDRARYFHMAGIVLASAALVYLGVTTYLNYVNKKGQVAYYAAYSEVMQEKTDAERAEALFKEVLEDHNLSKVSKLAVPQIGYLKYRENRHDDAATLYEEFTKNSSEKSPYRTLGLLALAAVHEEKGELEPAIAILRDLSSLPENAFMEQILLGLGRLYRLSGQEDKAAEVYKDFSTRFASSPFLAQVKAYLRHPS